MVLPNAVTYKVFIPLGSLYINTETLKKGFFSGNTKHLHKWPYICRRH